MKHPRRLAPVIVDFPVSDSPEPLVSKCRPAGVPRRTRRQPCANGRDGAAMVFVLVLLLVISMFSASLMRSSIALHRQRTRDEIRAQTVRLAEAGLARAQRRAAQDPAYSGDVWRLSAGELGPERVAEIRAEIAPEPGDVAGKRIRVTAEFPVDSPSVTRLSLDSMAGESETTNDQ